MPDFERYQELAPKADNVKQPISAQDVNFITGILSSVQKARFGLKDTDFHVYALNTMLNHPQVNGLWIDKLNNKALLDAAKSTNIAYSVPEQAVVFNPGSDALEAVVYSKFYWNPAGLPVKKVILLADDYVPEGCSVEYAVSNNEADFFTIEPNKENPVSVLPTNGPGIVVRVIMRRPSKDVSCRLDAWAFLFCDESIPFTTDSTLNTTTLSAISVYTPQGTVAVGPKPVGPVTIMETIPDTDTGGGTGTPAAITHDQLLSVTPDQHHPMNHHHGVGIDKVNLAADVTGVLSMGNLPVKEELMQEHKHDGTKISKISLATDVVGRLDATQLPLIYTVDLSNSKGKVAMENLPQELLDRIAAIGTGGSGTGSGAWINHRHNGIGMGSVSCAKIDLSTEVTGVLGISYLPIAVLRPNAKNIQGKIDLATQTTGILPVESLPEHTHDSGNTGPIDLSSDQVTGILGADHLPPIDLTTGVTGVLAKEHLPEDIGNGGGGTAGSADQIALGSPSDTAWVDGINPWTPETKVANALDDLNELLGELAPANCGPLGGSLIGGPTKYSGKLSSGLSESWYKDGKAAGDTVGELVVSCKGTFDNITFNNADSGLLKLELDGAVVATIDLAANFNEANRGSSQVITEYNKQGSGDVIAAGKVSFSQGTLEIKSIAKYNNFRKWQQGVAKIIIAGELAEGFHTLKVTRGTETTAAFKFWYDDDTTVPAIDADPVISDNAISGKMLSGVKFYTTGDSFNIAYTASGLFKKAYAANCSSYHIPGLNVISKNPAAIPAADETFTVNDQGVAFNQAGILVDDARLVASVTDPYGHNATRQSASEKRLVNTMTNRSTDLDEFFSDETYRLGLDHNFNSKVDPITNQWSSANPLTNGNAQCFVGGLIYPKANFTTGYKPSQADNDYSGFSGDQKYARAFKFASAVGSATLTLAGVTGGIAPVGQGDINIEIKLPGLTGWGDAAKPYDSAANKAADGWGMLNGSISGGAVKVTFGGLSTFDTLGLIYVRITLRNSNRTISRLTVA